MSFWIVSGSFRVNRGGCWRDGLQLARVAHRDFDAPGYRLDRLGLRLARRLP